MLIGRASAATATATSLGATTSANAGAGAQSMHALQEAGELQGIGRLSTVSSVDVASLQFYKFFISHFHCSWFTVSTLCHAHAAWTAAMSGNDEVCAGGHARTTTSRATAPASLATIAATAQATRASHARGSLDTSAWGEHHTTTDVQPGAVHIEDADDVDHDARPALKAECEHHIQQWIRAGLCVRNFESSIAGSRVHAYALSVPGAGYFWKCMHAGRAEMVRRIKARKYVPRCLIARCAALRAGRMRTSFFFVRAFAPVCAVVTDAALLVLDSVVCAVPPTPCRFAEISRRELLDMRLNKSPLPMILHVRDLLGSGLAVRLSTAAGEFISVK